MDTLVILRRLPRLLLLSTAVLLGACGDGNIFVDIADGNGDDDSTTADTSAWIMNTSGTQSSYIYTDSVAAEVNVQYVEVIGDYVVVNATGVPSYTRTMSQAIYDKLTARPNAASDFTSGAPSVSLGATVSFGQSIGYDSSSDCTSGQGAGYWPPGSGCPADTNKVGIFPVTPVVNTATCATATGVVGYFVNGVSLFNWSDGSSYQDKGVWETDAVVAGQYDLDICGGHTEAGADEYHHHAYSSCLASAVSDTGIAHSPIYGYAADGYPIYGPWYANGVLAQSSWVARDYDSSSDPYGCGGSGRRTCVMVDEYDAAQGTATASSNGPSTSTVITTTAGDELVATSGYYYQDYYWDSSKTDLGGAYLDQYNGHEHDDLGYHYHLTLSDASGSYERAFPYAVGPRFYGTLQSGAVASCR